MCIKGSFPKEENGGTTDFLVSFISSLMAIKEDIKPYHSYDKQPP